MFKKYALLVVLTFLGVACDSGEAEAVIITPTQIAVETVLTNTPQPSATVESTETATITSTPTATLTPMATVTNTPTAEPTNTVTTVPTNTATPTATAVPTETPVPTVAATADSGIGETGDVQTAVYEAIQSQLVWLDRLIFTLEPTVEIEYWYPVITDRNVNCIAYLDALSQVEAAPVIDVSAAAADVQHAYAVYRSGIDGIFVNQEVIEWTTTCQNAVAAAEEGNVLPGETKRGLIRQPMDEARHLLNQARSILEAQEG